jgi:VanZ family protein
MGILAFGLWPFNFHARNHVEWLPNGSGLHFGGYGEAYSRSQWTRKQPPDPDPGVTIELWVRSGERKYNQVSGLVSIVDSSPDCFSIAQSGPDVLVRGQFQDANHRVALRRIYIDDAFPQTQPRFLTVTSGPQGTALYLDGATRRKFPFVLTKSNFAGGLLLGHNFVGHQAWAGDLLGLAVYDRPLAQTEIIKDYAAWQHANAAELVRSPGLAALYLFDEGSGDVIHNRAGDAPDITIPLRFTELHKTFLSFSSNLDRANLDLSDIAENIAGFVPLGFFLCAFLRYGKRLETSRAILLAVILGGVTSLTIELLQAYLPSRESSLLDLLNNTFGTALGAALQCGVARVARRTYSPSL